MNASRHCSGYVTVSRTPGGSLSKISIRRSHSLPPQKAISVAKSIAADIERDYGVRSAWKGEMLQFKGAGVQGTLQLAPKEMVLEVQLGMMLFALRDSIAKQIERKFDQMLASQMAKPTKSRSWSMKRKKQSARSTGTAKKKRAKKTTRPRSAGSSRASESAAKDSGPFGASISKIFDFQRKMLEAGTAAARSAVDNPASQRVKDGVAESLQGGLRKLEQVFDERVAAALARMGMPSPEALHGLLAEVDALKKSGKSK
jgi:putative polyhydroxyalkanoate system protein